MIEKEVLRLIKQADKEKLPSLDLSDQQLTSLPPHVFELKHLKSLYLGKNQLKTLSSNIGQLKALVWLDVSHNQLAELPPKIGNLKNLTVLDCSNNRLCKIPAQIKQLRKITSLNLSNNRIASLPREISYLKSLTQLDLSANKIKRFPASITSIENLIWLYFNDNKLATIPSRISKLERLSELRLRGNQISELPVELAKLAHLTDLDLRDNQLSWPIDVLENVESPDALLDFLSQLHEQEEVLHEAKLLIVGEAGAGKTSLSKKIQDENYKLREDESSTVGIEVSKWLYKEENKQFRANIWDFSGQEINYATHQFFLTDQSLYLLVADSRREDTNFSYWLGIIEAQSKGSPILIIKNEKQGCRHEINELQLKENFGSLQGFLATDLYSNKGLNDILAAIKDQIRTLPHIGTILPKRWGEVREALEYSELPYINQQEFISICYRFGFTERQAIAQLSRRLHFLGICLHFQADTSLSEVVFLKPTWLTNAIYRVLFDNQIRNNQGRFDKASLDRIWEGAEYEGMRSKLIDLMVKFRLCYEVPNEKNSYIAPQLLAPNPPKEYMWDNSSDNLVLQYQYRFMPKGIFSRLVVELSKLIDNNCVWKTGVVLCQDGTKARVTEDYNDREGKIEIRIAGKRKKDFLNRIVYGLDDRIHTEFKGLKCERYVFCRCASCIEREEPHAYKLNVIKGMIEHKKFKTTCELEPYHEVDILALVDDYNLRDFLSINPVTSHTSINVSNSNIENLSSFVNKGDISNMSNISQNHFGKGDNVAGDKNVSNIHNSQDLTQAAKEIQQLLIQLSQDHPYDSSALIGAKAITEVESKPLLKERIIKAIRAGGSTAVEKLVEHPAVSILLSAVNAGLDG